jgi:hypothetical protein
VQWDGADLATGISADSNGRWSAECIVPEAANGLHALTAFGPLTMAGAAGFRTFNVTSWLSITPTSGKKDTKCTIHGRGFSGSTPHQAVTVNITIGGYRVSTHPTTVKTNGNGTFVASFTVPDLPTSAIYNIAATDSNGITGAAPFSYI